MIGTEHDKPGGFMEEHWQRFLNKFKDGDELWTFETPPYTWASMCGRAGYVILRDGEYVDGYCTVMS